MTFATDMRVGSLETLAALGAFALLALRGRPVLADVAETQRPASVELEIIERGRSRRVEVRCPFVVGRATDAEVLLMDPEASRHHARFESDGTAVFVTDLQSSNGIYLNGQRVTDSIEVRAGDAIDLGSTRMIFTGSTFGTDH